MGEPLERGPVTREAPVSNPRYANGARRRALRARVLAAYDTCALCGLPVDKNLPPVHDGAPEVDEIIPVSLGGNPLRWDNVQLAHRLCNRRKGNGTHTARLDAPAQPRASRAW